MTTVSTSKMLRQELQSYFDRVYPHSKIETEYSVVGQVHIRFELDKEYDNATIERVNQATNRAVKLFKDIFDNPKNVIWILIYEYPEPNAFNASNEYLHRQFPSEQFENFYNQLEQVNTREFITDKNGHEVSKKTEVRIIIGKLAVEEINIENILRGIANTEMGFDPGVDQTIFFFDPLTDKAFLMYDDRGCIIWSDTADKIRDVYIKRNEWIVDNYRPEIEKNFK
jgi:hypothetical protein